MFQKMRRKSQYKPKKQFTCQLTKYCLTDNYCLQQIIITCNVMLYWFRTLSYVENYFLIRLILRGTIYNHRFCIYYKSTRWKGIDNYTENRTVSWTIIYQHNEWSMVLVLEKYRILECFGLESSTVWVWSFISDFIFTQI